MSTPTRDSPSPKEVNGSDGPVAVGEGVTVGVDVDATFGVGDDVTVGVGVAVGVNVAFAVGECVGEGVVVTGTAGVGVATTGEAVGVGVAGRSGESPPQAASATAAEATRAHLLRSPPTGMAERVPVPSRNYPVRFRWPVPCSGLQKSKSSQFSPSRSGAKGQHVRYCERSAGRCQCDLPQCSVGLGWQASRRAVS